MASVFSPAASGAEELPAALTRACSAGAGVPAEACRTTQPTREREWLENRAFADVLERVAELLELQDASPFRVRAYRHAAHELRRLHQPVRGVLAQRGIPGLEALPGIGPSIGAALAEYLETGRLGLLQRLEGQTAPEELFATLPGIGEELARRIHCELGVETLAELELAAHDGRLSSVPGFGPRRVRALRDALASRLSRRPRRWPPRASPAPSSDQPDVLEPPSLPVPALLTLDAEYRARAARGELHRIAPRRFNPTHAAWLPIWHTEHDGWHVTALYSNTALAHQLGTTRDWVVLHCERQGHEEQSTIVTERRGPLAGQRVVRGREDECLAHYQASRRSVEVRATPEEPPRAPATLAGATP